MGTLNILRLSYSLQPSLSDSGGDHGHHAGPAGHLQESRGPRQRYQHRPPPSLSLSLTLFSHRVLEFQLSPPAKPPPSPQTTCAGTPCPPCWAWAGRSDDTATLTSRCCPNCSRDRRRPRCPPRTTPTRRTAAPSTTSAPSCRALCSPCARETPCGAKAPHCPACRSR